MEEQTCNWEYMEILNRDSTFFGHFVRCARPKGHTGPCAYDPATTTKRSVHDVIAASRAGNA